MSTRFVFPLRDVEEFETRYSASFQISKNQFEEKDEGPAVRLTLGQLSSVAGNMMGNGNAEAFIMEEALKFSPLSMSLFVFNDALWKMMKKKAESRDTMLPMVTIPRFHWVQESVSPGNPLGVERDEIHRANLSYAPNQSLVIQGVGGDFSGILEAQLVELRPDSRAIISPFFPPSMPDRLSSVPKYDLCDITVTLGTDRLNKELYPAPKEEIDYSFSEHPKVFFEHGLAIETVGSNVQLKVGNRRPQALFGDVVLLLGKKWGPTAEGYKIVEFHVWLTSLFNSLW